MKFIHLSDLHLGKRLNEFSLLEDQEHILKQITEIIREEDPDGVLIAGDVYDKAVPSAEAVRLFDDFLWGLAEQKIPVFVISGNHDSPERIAFGSRLMDQRGVYMSPVFSGKTEPITLEDEYGLLDLYLLPFIKPAHARKAFPEASIETYTDAVKAAVEAMDLKPDRRNVLVTHQFVTGALRSESEELSVGGTDNVDASVFDAFDYVALGHIHRPQYMEGSRIRYSGTPLKYSFSEAGHEKSVTVVGLQEKGTWIVFETPLTPLRDLREIRGTYEELTALKNYQGTNTQDYLHITLTDEEDVPEALGRLRVIYPNLMKLDYDNTRTRTSGHTEAAADMESKTPLQLFGEFYEDRNGQPMSSEQEAFVRELIEKIWEGEK
ncbi:MAG: exonuclease SbcCD subunit D [Firmicutes bacterium]|nr:exonuclease SbcCD subunit D [Bacillota bacterium]